MKKILFSAALIALFGSPAFAQSKSDHPGNCPAKTCTDHSHDKAYSSGTTNADRTYHAPDEYTVKTKNSKKSCPAKTCTDHSLDKAYSPEWSAAVGAGQETTYTSNNTTSNTSYTAGRTNNSDMRDWLPNNDVQYYNVTGYTVYGKGTTGVNRPSAYEGDFAPTYEGPEVNAYRNLRSNNDSEPIPANNGK